MSMNKKTTTIFYIGTWLLFFVTEGCGIFCGIISDTNTKNILFILTVSLSAIVSLLFLFLEENHIATTLMLPVLTFFVCSAYFEDIAKKNFFFTLSFLLFAMYIIADIILTGRKTKNFITAILSDLYSTAALLGFVCVHLWALGYRNRLLNFAALAYSAVTLAIREIVRAKNN